MRYYYTCPLKAAWMCKYIGMDITTLSLEQQENRIYVHPLSYEIFDPQVYDIILGGIHSWRVGLMTNEERRELSKDDADLIIKSGGIIILRRGISFMWPEVEQ